MGRTYEEIDGRLKHFLESQPVFFVATAPLADAGHINCSPKGTDGSFAVIDGHRVAYLDLTGSGVETVAHLQENGRIVLMFCAFSGPPRVIRLHGTGSVFKMGDPGFDDAVTRFAPNPGARAAIVIDVERISDSCGYSVPLFDFRAHRDKLDKWVVSRGGAEGLLVYRAEKNSQSIDGLAGLKGPITGLERPSADTTHPR
ncbi:MAG: pyridoxamine 5'-phosphate oxidase family protein [Acidimicrobiales bacterium]